jgi:Protein of unknown function (DUF1353)
MTHLHTPADTAVAPVADWHPWNVAPASRFEVDDALGEVEFSQIDATNFLVRTAFRFSDERVLTMLRQQIGGDPETAARMVDDARMCPAWVVTSPGADSQTDMASVPQFLRWFENTYGVHTLAAIIHDRLITDDGPNKGALGSDTLSDRFFREMMGSSGVPFLKRWIMWAAVAMRTRWAAGGHRRVTLVLWLLLATASMTLSVAWAGTVFLHWHRLFGLPSGAMAAVALVMPFASAPLWGRQYGASIVAAAAALWILPPAVFAGLGYCVYLVLEKAIDRITGTRRSSRAP